MNNLEKLNSKLNDLVTKNYDAEKGYKQAADLAESTQLKAFFKNQAQNRYDFGHALKAEIKSTGGDVDKGTSFTGDAHRAWMSIKDAFSANDDKAMLQEVVRGEEEAVEEYQEVMRETQLAPTTQDLLKKQVHSVQSALSKARTLEAWEEK